jgi:hypothetical protein
MRRGRSSEPDRCQNRSPKSAGIQPRLTPLRSPFRAINTIIFLQTPALILINLQLFGRRCRELLFVWVCGLTATLTSEVRNYWRDGLTEFGLEQTMLAL